MKNILLIMNPNSGTKKANKYLTDILVLFKEYDYHTNVCVTSKTEDVYDYIKIYHFDNDMIVCIGGDGTVNNVINAMMLCGADKPIGYIPAGSTNDFATGLNLNKNIMNAAADIMSGNLTNIDIGKFNEKYFSYTASCGLFTKASYSTSQADKNVFGRLAYVLEGIKDLAQVKSNHLKFETDNGVFEDEYVFAAICNSVSVGGFLTLDRDYVDYCDGKFELLLVKMPKNLVELNTIIFSLNSKDYSSDLITFCSIKKAKIHCFNRVDWTLDGEYMPGTEIIDMNVVSDKIKYILPS